MEKVLPSLEDFKPHDIVERLMYYVYLGDGREYYVLGAYVILTYIHRLFDIIPNLIIRGKRGWEGPLSWHTLLYGLESKPFNFPVPCKRLQAPRGA